MCATLQIAKPKRQARRVSMLLTAAGVLLIAVLVPVYRLQELSWPEAIAASITFVVPCFLLGWAVWRLLTRRPRASSLMRVLATHAAIATVFSITWTIPLVVLVYLLRKEISIDYLSGGAVWQLAWGLVIYCVLLLAARMHRRFREQELAAAGLELQVLRTQLDPHFLFNTLHSLMQLAREDPVATQDALQRFAELMRYVLKSGRKAEADVALEHELEFVRNYLALEQLRLGDRLRVVEHVELETLELAVPPLLLQPLVENAVRHGLSPRRDGGTIRLSASMKHDQLMICVSDDGIGAEPARLSESKGVGLKAVARQLQAHFPGSAEFAVDTQPRAGFSVKLTLPARVPNRRSQNAHNVSRG